MDNYLIGNVIRLAVSFLNFDGQATDPTSVSITIKKRSGTAQSFTPSKDSVGNYHYDFTPAEPGTYSYRFSGTGALVAAVEGNFTVTRSKLA